MLVKLEKYIFHHLEEWGLKARKLTPLLCFNQEANGVVHSEQIGMVIFWFAEKLDQPLLVTKTFSRPIQDCRKTDCFFNHMPYYPKIYAIKDSTIFMEAIKGMTYEMELSLALFGPEGNRDLVYSSVQRHLTEMSQIYREFSKIEVQEFSFTCGDWISKKGKEWGLFTDKTLSNIQRILDCIPYTNHHILMDHNSANIFPGPYFVDQYDSISAYKKRKENEPGILDPIRFLIAYFRASPLSQLYKDWVLTLGCALHDDKQELIISQPVQTFFKKLDWSKEMVWALLILGFAFRMRDELKFHEKNVYVSQLKRDLSYILNQLINAHRLFLTGNQRLLKQIKKIEKDFIFPAEKKIEDRSSYPRLLKKDYKNYNLVSMGEQIYAVKRCLGTIDLAVLPPGQMKSLVRRKKILVSPSLQDIKRTIDRNLVNTLIYFLKLAFRKLDKYCLFRYTYSSDRAL